MRVEDDKLSLTGFLVTGVGSRFCLSANNAVWIDWSFAIVTPAAIAAIRLLLSYLHSRNSLLNAWRNTSDAIFSWLFLRLLWNSVNSWDTVRMFDPAVFWSIWIRKFLLCCNVVSQKAFTLAIFIVFEELDVEHLLLIVSSWCFFWRLPEARNPWWNCVLELRWFISSVIICEPDVMRGIRKFWPCTIYFNRVSCSVSFRVLENLFVMGRRRQNFWTSVTSLRLLELDNVFFKKRRRCNFLTSVAA